MSRLPPASAGDPTGQGRHLTAPATSGGRGAHPPVPLGRTSSLGWPRRRASCLLLRPRPPPPPPCRPFLPSAERGCCGAERVPRCPPAARSPHTQRGPLPRSPLCGSASPASSRTLSLCHSCRGSVIRCPGIRTLLKFATSRRSSTLLPCYRSVWGFVNKHLQGVMLAPGSCGFHSL